MTYRLALDLGSTSLGWCLLETTDGFPSRVVDIGVRIFPDGRESKSKEPLAVTRRNARGVRRNADRRKRRQKNLIQFLSDAGLFPSDKHQRLSLQQKNPYDIRSKGVDEEIPLYDLGRALIHINQRRGFKSNRKTDAKENQLSNMKLAMRDLEQDIGDKTIGQYLKSRDTKRVRTSMVKNKAEYNFYPTRAMYEDEVDRLLEKQRIYHSSILTESVCEKIKDILFYQRNLKKQDVGQCVLDNSEKRARLAYSETQKFRILQEVNNLEIERFSGDEPQLTKADREQLVQALLKSKKMSFSQIRKLLDIPRSLSFNLEKANRKELKGDSTYALCSDAACFGSLWDGFATDEKRNVVDYIFEEQNPEKCVRYFQEKYGLEKEQAENISKLNSKLVPGYGRVSLKAIEKIRPFLEEGDDYALAAQKAGYHHSDFRTGEVFDVLPYYGEVLQDSVIGGTFAEEDKNFPEKYFGKINNPTVHIVLNQVQKLVNAILETYGDIDEVVIEMARDLKGNPSDIQKQQNKNKKDNDRINKELEKLNVTQNYKNRMLFKLWEDLSNDPLKRQCPFSGKTIGKHDIFTGEFEEEHLLPFSRSYNDSRSNKVLAHRDWNRRKGNKSPYEAFGHLPEWEDMLARADNLPDNKKWRFKQDAWDQIEGKDGIIARMLNDTRYMSRATKKYLSAIFDNEKGRNKVWVIPGQMTAFLRHQWGLNNLLGEDDNQKDRSDHRHHAVDAFTIGCSDRGMFKKLSDAAKRLEDDEGLYEKRRKLVAKFPDPFDGYYDQLSEKLDQLLISYKPDHGNPQKAIKAKKPYTVSSLHQDTAYGFIKKGEKKNTSLVATRKPLESFESRKDLEKIADETIKQSILSLMEDTKDKSAEWKQKLEEYSAKTGTRRLRIHIEKSNDVLIGIKQPLDKGPEKTRGKEYKFYQGGNNHCAEIYQLDKGKKAGQWQCEIISSYDIHQKGFIPNWRKENPTAKLIMRLHINDVVAYEEDGQTVYRKVRKLNAPKTFVLLDIYNAKPGNNEGWQASAKQFQLKNGRKVSIDILGRLKDSVVNNKKQQA